MILDMKNFDKQSFSDELISCPIRLGSQGDDQISWKTNEHIVI